ncbi:hypothetical protein CYLTODRAFT_426396 [Cylindrobasidium torrendii FP15055 ss-10]|uniref:Uncharacterized protein n=1 Tax=Cylindrobasidium torrendii FP15055 ss-10 TaxID=1314674 RepID=A0A0D7AYW7_9AGAR|nr:hypothetical protein CYLTODRAFT_426396 [Cylindrobasidium torrendii FP15055 ss-10]
MSQSAQARGLLESLWCQVVIAAQNAPSSLSIECKRSMLMKWAALSKVTRVLSICTPPNMGHTNTLGTSTTHYFAVSVRRLSGKLPSLCWSVRRDIRGSILHQRTQVPESDMARALDSRAARTLLPCSHRVSPMPDAFIVDIASVFRIDTSGPLCGLLPYLRRSEWSVSYFCPRSCCALA